MKAAELARRFKRPVLDQTGLRGSYDFRVEFAADDAFQPLGILQRLFLRRRQVGGRHVLEVQPAMQRRQSASLLEHC